MNVTCPPPAANAKPSFLGGGRRHSVPDPAFRTDYGFATADAKSDVDASWPVVDAPHDFIAEYANFTNNIEDFKQGYLPRNASWCALNCLWAVDLRPRLFKASRLPWDCRPIHVFARVFHPAPPPTTQTRILCCSMLSASFSFP